MLTKIVVVALCVVVFRLYRKVQLIEQKLERGTELPAEPDTTQPAMEDVAALAIDRHVTEYHKR